MATRFRLEKRNHYPWLFLALVAISLTAIFTIVPPPRSFELSIPTIGVAAGFVYFLYAQHLQETRLFSELFRQFNERYDRLNDKLNAIASRDGEALHSDDDKQALFDYFNLCAEEYLYFTSGYIDEKVWVSWLRGMKYFAQSTAIRRLWEAELKGGSYYGFNLSLIDNVP